MASRYFLWLCEQWMETFASWKKPENFFLSIQLYVNFVNEV